MIVPDDPQDSQDQQSDEEFDDSDDYRGKNGLIFLIDFRKKMFGDGVFKESFFRQSLASCKELMRDIAKAGRDDLFAIYLMGCEKGDAAMSLPSLGCLHKLLPVRADTIKNIDNILLDKADSLISTFGQMDGQTPLSFAEILRQCRRIFSENPRKVYSKGVVVLSNDDNPCKDHTKLVHAARSESKRMYSAGIELVPVAIGADFDSNRFYNDLVLLSKGSSQWQEVNLIKEMSHMETTLRNVISRLSRTFRNFHLTPYSNEFGSKNVSIPVALFNLYKEPKVKMVSRNVGVETADTEASQLPVDGQPAPVDGKDNKDGSNNDLWKNISQRVRNEERPLVNDYPVPITREEMESIANKISVGITLIGFMPMEEVLRRCHLTVAVPKIMLPNYYSNDGVEAYCALLDACHRREKTMICWYKYNKMSTPTLVACHPMEEQVDSQGNVCPRAFCLVTVPFAENYMEPEYEVKNVEPCQEQKDAAVQIVSKLSTTYEVGMFHDAQYQKSLAMIEALALDFDSVPEVEDDTIINMDDISEKLGDLSTQLMENPKLSDSRRRGGDQIDPNGVLKPKRGKSFSMSEMVETCQMNRAESLTKEQLKELFIGQGIFFGGNAKKPELVEIANKHFCKK